MLFDYYKQILLINKEDIPFDIKRHIFSYLKKDYQNKFNQKYIIKKFNTVILKNKFFSVNATFHLNELPYPDIISKEVLKDNIDILIDIHNINLVFTHYCCNDSGICYESPNNKNILNFNLVI